MQSIQDKKRRLLEQIEWSKLLYKSLKEELEAVEREIKTMNSTTLDIDQGNQQSEKIKNQEKLSAAGNIGQGKKKTTAAGGGSYDVLLNQKAPKNNSKIATVAKESLTAKAEFCHINMYDAIHDTEARSALFREISVISLEQLGEFSHQSFIPGDLATVGIIYHKSKLMKISNKRIMVFWMTDLRGGYCRLFLSGTQLEERLNDEIGTVVGLIKPKFAMPPESLGAMGLYLDKGTRYLPLGKSVDLGSCRQSGCEQVVNSSGKAEYCPDHIEENYRKHRSQHQEFAVGNSLFQVGAPKEKGVKSKVRTIATEATYKVFGETVISVGRKAAIRLPLKPSTQRTEKEKIESIVNMHGQGSKLLRDAMGLERAPGPDLAAILGAKAIAKMNGNPLKNHSPGSDKVQRDPSNKSAPVTPSKKIKTAHTAALSSDDDNFILEIV